MPMPDTDLSEVIRQDLFWKAGLFLVEIDREDLKIDRRTPLHIEQQVEQRVAVLSAGKTDHYPVALVDHSEIGDRTAYLLEQLCFCLCLNEQLFRFPPKPLIFARLAQ